ncbi:hypothetical protein [Streptomyces hiroshimensis]|uniref:Uncharacterized protein n=1 Tax=Streptomyces hiroshimensis TaxID=66424 RepID=A0ABQ2Z859_9ACTN|nr:hypothetical protein [Streptomyces hiroshimensis]GGY08043.1 hypothetical protein GCM10010324_63720 [Streptomyces hiroshimensis]
MEAWDAVFDGQYRPGEDGDGLIRVGRSGAWSFAVEYGDSTGRERLLKVSHGGVDAVRLDPMPEHPPKTFDHARDGQLICSFGIGEEHWRGGTEQRSAHQEEEPYKDRDRRTIGIIERHFGLSLPRKYVVAEGVLPFFAVRGTPEISDFEEADETLDS